MIRSFKLSQLVRRTIGSCYYFARVKPKLTIAVSFILLALSLPGLNELRFSLTTQDLIGHSSPEAQRLLKLKDLFPIKSTLYYILESPENDFTSAQLCAIQNKISDLRLEQDLEIFSAYDIRRATLTPDARLFYTRVLDPCTADASAQGGLKDLKSPFWDRLLLSENRRDLLFEVRFDPIEPPGPYGEVDLKKISNTMAWLDSNFKYKNTYSGPAAFYKYSFDGISRAQLLNLGILIFVILAFRTLFGTWKSGFIFVGTLLFTNAILHGGMGYAGDYLNPLTVSIFLMIAIATVEDFIFICYSQKQSTNALPKMREVLVPGFLTSLTTAIGFASLMTSEVETIRAFGMWTALGAILEWMALFILLPALMTVFPRLRNLTNFEKSYFSNISVKLLSHSLPPFVSKLALGVFVLCALGLSQFQLSFSILDLLPKNHPMHQASHTFLETRGWDNEVSLVFNDYDNKEANQAKINELIKDPMIGKVEDPYSLMVDFSGKTDGQYKELIEREYSSSQFARRLIASSGETRAILYLKSSDVQSVNRLATTVNKLCADHSCYLSGELVAYTQFTEQVIKTLFDSLLTGLIAIVAILIVLTLPDRLHLAAPIAISALWGPAAILAAISYLGIKVDIVTVVVASTLVGLAGDNAVHFLFGKEYLDMDKSISQKGQGAIQCSLVMAFASLLLVFSYFQSPRILGLLLFFGLIASLFGDIWILKSLLPKRK